MQAIYATLKDESNSDIQYLLGNLPELTEEALQAMHLPDGVTIEEYRKALAADIIWIARKLVSACRASGQRREDFVLTIVEGNKVGSWTDSNGNPLPLPTLQLLRDCETRWSSTFLMLDRVITLLPVCTSHLSWGMRIDIDVGRRRSRLLSCAQDRQAVTCRHSCSIVRRCALQDTFARLSKFHTLPRNSSRPIEHRLSLSPFQSMTNHHSMGS